MDFQTKIDFYFLASNLWFSSENLIKGVVNMQVMQTNIISNLKTATKAEVFLAIVIIERGNVRSDCKFILT